MRDLKRQERAAIEAVAQRFAATWEERGPADACLTVAGKRVAVDIATLKQRGMGQGSVAKPHLRFDRVATGLIARLQTSLGEGVPRGTTVVLTVTAPIRLPAKTAAVLEERVEALLRRGSPGRDVKDTVHGNRVRIRLVRHKGEGAPRVMGFVHNPDSDPLLLFNMTRELLELFRGAASACATSPVSDRWLVVTSAGGSSCLDAYRYIYSQLRFATTFRKVVMVFGDGRVGKLTG